MSSKPNVTGNHGFSSQISNNGLQVTSSNDSKKEVSTPTLQEVFSSAHNNEALSQQKRNKKISAKPISPVDSKKPLDLSKIYFEVTLECQAATHTETHNYYVPISKLPDKFQKKAIEMATEEDHAIGKLSDAAKLRGWKQNCDEAYLVDSIIPLRIRGMDSVIFLKRYGNTLSKVIEALFSSQGSLSVDKATNSNHNNSNSTHSVRANHIQTQFETHSIVGGSIGNKMRLFINGNSAHHATKAWETMCTVFNKHKKQLVILINQKDTVLSPFESNGLLWEMLSLTAVQASSLSLNEKEVLVCQLLKMFEDLRECIYTANLFVQTEDFPQAKNYHEKAIAVIENWGKEIQSNITAPTLLQSLNNIQQMLCQLFKSLNLSKLDLEEELVIEAFYTQLEDFFKEKLNDWNKLTVFMNSSGNLLKTWLASRAAIITLYLSKIHQDSNILNLLAISKNIELELNNRNWISAYNLLLQLLPHLYALVKPSQVIIHEDSRSSYPKKMIPIYSQKVLVLKRIENFAKALFIDFEQIILAGKLFYPVSEVACKKLSNSIDSILLPLSKNHLQGKDFLQWIVALKNNNYPDLFDSWNDLQICWRGLKEEKENPAMLSSFPTIISMLKEIQSGDNSNLIKQYQLAHEVLIKPTQCWMGALRQFNKCIEGVQRNCILMLLDPTIPLIDVAQVKAIFSAFNKRLLELVSPISEFYNAFHQLICLGKHQFQQIGGNESIPFSLEEGSFRLKLFETNDEYFRELSSQVNEIRKSNAPATFEIEEDNLGQSQPVDLSSKQTMEFPIDLENQVKTVFKSTKRRVVLKELLRLLKDLKIDFHTCFGKGDHNKIYINKIPVSLPEHEEWKPGTAHSIENDMIEQLQLAIQKRELEEKQKQKTDK